MRFEVDQPARARSDLASDGYAGESLYVPLISPGVIAVHNGGFFDNAPPLGCFRHQLLLPRPYLVLTKPLRLDIQCQRAASVKIGWKYLDD